MFVPHKELNSWHLRAALCCRGEQGRQRRLADEESQEGTEIAINSYGISLYPVTSFKYMGRFLLVEDNNWPTVVHNLLSVR